MKAVASIGDNAITPKEYSGLMRMLNRAIEGTQYTLPTGSVWSLREALETDLNAFGGRLTKDNLLKDSTIKEGYEAMVTQSGKEFADADIAFKITQGEQLYSKLKDANGTFSALMGFIKSPLIRSFRNGLYLLSEGHHSLPSSFINSSL